MNELNYQRPPEAIALANQAVHTSLKQAGVALANDYHNLQPGQVVLANDSILRGAVPIMDLTMWAAGYDAMVGNGLVKLRDFLAPPRPTDSRIFRLTSYVENEPWETVDYTKVKRGMLADFAEVRQRAVTKADLQGFNRGLSVILDRDEIAAKPEWVQLHAKWLIDLLNRASILETMATYQGASVAASTVWDSSSNPDLDLKARILALADTTGFYPQNVAYGDRALLKRQNAYESELTAGSLARAAAVTEEALATVLGVSQVLVNAERYQNTGTAKQEIIGSNVLLFTGIKEAGPMDPSNIVRHVFTGRAGGGEYAVYQTDLGVKKVAITVENYELIHTQHTSGIMMLAVN